MKKILVLGGGFGGIRVAIDLKNNLRDQAEITVIDKNNYHLFIPAIYEVASAYGIKRDPFAIQLKKTVCLPYSDIFEGQNIKFMNAEIAKVDLTSKKVTTNGGHAMDFDCLVLSLGSETSDYNIPGVKEYAHQFKFLEDSLFINQHLSEIANQFSNGQRNEPLNILVCGAGFTGVELAAELGCCMDNIRKACKMKGRCSSITLIEASPRMLPMLSEKERGMIRSQLTKLGIIIMENSPIEEIGPDFIKLKNGQKIKGDLIIWTAGIKANRFLGAIPGLTLTPAGKVMVNENLSVKNYDNVFAIGDNMEFIDPKTQKPVPALAYVAIAQGKLAAKNISSSVLGKKLSKYKPSYNVSIVPVGGKFAVAHFGGVVIGGFIGWIIRGLTDLRYFMSILPFKKAIKVYWDEMTVFTRND